MSLLTGIRNALSTINIRLFSFYLAIVLIIPAISTIIEYMVTVSPGLRSSLQIDMQNFHIYQLSRRHLSISTSTNTWET